VNIREQLTADETSVGRDDHRVATTVTIGGDLTVGRVG
jgi:hypothetical protein